MGSGGEKRLSRIQWVGRVFKDRVSVRRNHKPSHRNVQSLRWEQSYDSAVGSGCEVVRNTSG